MNNARRFSFFDKLIIESDRVLRTLTRPSTTAVECSPSKAVDESTLSSAERKHSAGLMRVNHTGEVCAQALYQGQSLTAKLPDIREEMETAAKEEVNHLNWCVERLEELDSRPSRLNPIFYGLSFSMGALAGTVSDKVSLGFVAATEELVCEHLERHLDELPKEDHKSRAIIREMLEDESRHQQAAINAGGSEFPMPIKLVMKTLSKAMTISTYHI